MTQISSLQDQTDIPVGNEIACMINNVGIARFPGFDARNNIPNVLEINLGPKYANDRSGELLNRKSNRHMRLGVLHEIDRAVIGQSLNGSLKTRRGAEIRTRIGRHGASAGDVRLFRPAAIKRYGLRYCRCQVKKSFQLKSIFG